jgi:hypothetical protein
LSATRRAFGSREKPVVGGAAAPFRGGRVIETPLDGLEDCDCAAVGVATPDDGEGARGRLFRLSTPHVSNVAGATGVGQLT